MRSESAVCSEKRALFVIPDNAEDDDQISKQLDAEFAQARSMVASGAVATLEARRTCMHPGAEWSLVQGMSHLYIQRYPTLGMGWCMCREKAEV